MKKLLFLVLMAWGAVAWADDDVVVQVLPGHSFEAARDELASMGWKINGYVSYKKSFSVTNPNWTFTYNGAVLRLRDIQHDPNSTSGEYHAVINALVQTFSVLIHSEFLYPQGFETENSFYNPRPAYTSYNFSSACQLPANDGTPNSNNPKAAILDGYPVWQASNPTILNGHIKNGLTQEVDQFWWNLLVSSPGYSWTSDMNHGNAIAEIALQYVGAAFFTYQTYDIENAVTDMIQNGVKTVVMPVAHRNISIGNKPSKQEQVQAELERAFDGGVFPIRSAGNTEINGLTGQVDTVDTEEKKAIHDSDKVLVVTSHDGAGDHVGPCSNANDKAIDVSVRSDNMTVNGHTIAGASTSFSSAIMDGITNDIFVKHPGVNSPDKMMKVIVNSTKVVNNRAVKDQREGWGKFDACAAYDYAKNNYPNLSGYTVTWVIVAEHDTTINQVNAGAARTNAFKESCLLHSGIPHQPPAQPQFVSCDSGGGTANVEAPIYMSVGYPTPIWSAWPDGIPH